MGTNINRCFTALFHRANLYMRQANAQRSFGNKTTWDTPFESHFRQFVSEIADLVYIDPPYFNARGGGVNYYETWGENIDYTSKHRRLIPEPNLWSRPEHILSTTVRVAHLPKQYALSKRRSHEILLVARSAFRF